MAPSDATRLIVTSCERSFSSTEHTPCQKYSWISRSERNGKHESSGEVMVQQWSSVTEYETLVWLIGGESESANNNNKRTIGISRL